MATALARDGWRVAIVGRREAPLQAVAAEAPGKILPLPADVADPAAVQSVIDRALSEWGRIDVLVNAAGTNAKQRSWSELSVETYQEIMGANLDGAFYMSRAVLPTMRRQRSGTVVNVVSDAGLRANATAGAAYVASKFGMTGLTQSLLEEERTNGIRACAIFPGEIDTPLLEKRPHVPPPDARGRMLTPEDVAACVLLAIRLPPNAVVEQLLIRPR